MQRLVVMSRAMPVRLEFEVLHTSAGFQYLALARGFVSVSVWFEQCATAAGLRGRGDGDCIESWTIHSSLKFCLVRESELSELNTPIATQTSFHKTLSRRIDIPNLLIFDEGF